MKKISIVGCGTIGSEVAMAIDREEIRMNLVSLYDIDKKKAIDLKNQLKNIHPNISENLGESVSQCDLVFEATHVSSLKEIAEETFRSKKDLFVMSVGGLVISPEILDKAKTLGCKVFFPSGAIAGLDVVSALKLSNIESITLKSTKPLKSFANSPGLDRFLKSTHKRMEDIQQAETLFEGNVKEAVPLFPQNVNISAALALTGVGPEKTKVTIVADPAIKKNIHEITCVSAAGAAYTRTENVPHPKNPKTSYLAILSAIAKLKEF